MNRIFSQYAKHFTPGTGDQPVPANLWSKCPECRELTYVRQLDDNDKVCVTCGFHFPLSEQEWLGHLLDAQSFVNDHCEAASGFVSGSGTIMGRPLELLVAKTRWPGDQLSALYADAFARTVQRAIERGTALVTVVASEGPHAHLHTFPSIIGTMVLAPLMRLAHAGQPHIAVVSGICCEEHCVALVGHADIVVAEPGLRMKRNTGKAALPTRGKQLGDDRTGNRLLQRGVVDAVVHRTRLPQTLGGLVRIYAERGYSTDEVSV